MLRRFRWAVWFRMWVHSAPLAPLATCWAHDQSSGSDFTSQYAMPALLLPRGSRPTIADLVALVKPSVLPTLRGCSTIVQAETPMNIVVTVKQVPDPNTPAHLLTIDPSAKRVLPAAGIPPVMNGYDANALEEAVRLKETRGAKVVTVSVGDYGARDALRRSIALGATEAVHVEDAPDLASSSAAEVLAAAIGEPGLVSPGLCRR